MKSPIPGSNNSTPFDCGYAQAVYGPLRLLRTRSLSLLVHQADQERTWRRLRGRQRLFPAKRRHDLVLYQYYSYASRVPFPINSVPRSTMPDQVLSVRSVYHRCSSPEGQSRSSLPRNDPAPNPTRFACQQVQCRCQVLAVGNQTPLVLEGTH
jgi:hypothetical protein